MRVTLNRLVGRPLKWHKKSYKMSQNLGRPRLIGDIGGTNARFAMVDDNTSGYAFQHDYFCANFPTVIDAIRCYLDQIEASLPESVHLAVAGPVDSGQVR